MKHKNKEDRMKWSLESIVPSWVEIVHRYHIRMAYVGGSKIASAITDDELVKKVKSYLLEDLENMERKQRENGI